MKLAIFDIDGTLLRGSTERRFFWHLATHGRLGPRQLAAFVWFLARYWRQFGVDTLRKNKAYLTGLESTDVRGLAATFVSEKVVPSLREPVVERLRQHQRLGDTVVLLSGTVAPIARALADALGVAHVCATVGRERDGRYLAQPPESHPFDATKLALAERLAAELGGDLHQASAYGDSRHDLQLLERVGTPVAVSPDAGLLAAAVDRGWEIIAVGRSPRGLPQRPYI
jgi:HAD superfamily hydrolase (TIGR01490 family)